MRSTETLPVFLWLRVTRLKPFTPGDQIQWRTVPCQTKDTELCCDTPLKYFFFLRDCLVFLFHILSNTCRTLLAGLFIVLSCCRCHWALSLRRKHFLTRFTCLPWNAVFLSHLHNPCHIQTFILQRVFFLVSSLHSSFEKTRHVETETESVFFTATVHWNDTLPLRRLPSLVDFLTLTGQAELLWEREEAEFSTTDSSAPVLLCRCAEVIQHRTAPPAACPTEETSSWAQPYVISSRLKPCVWERGGFDTTGRGIKDKGKTNSRDELTHGS